MVVIAHGASEHGGRYAWVAERLTQKGFAVYAGDHRGHGRSGGPRALVDRMDNVVRDLDSVVEMAQTAHPGTKTVLLGHSMGGAVAIAYAIEHQDRLDLLVLSAPLAVLEAASPVERAAARVLSAVAPRVGVYAIDSEGVSRDPAVVRDYDADPLNHHGKLPARSVKELTDAIAGFPEGLATLSLPVLTMHGTADTLTLPAGSGVVIENAGSEDKSIIRYEGLYHELLNEPERQKVLDDVVEWVEARL
ncbi:MAG TPA: lysophospholipase [Thermoleophilaceae bacterium]|nr:lysophospholipase [Thermoleophilaceae bacterium]